VSDGAEAPATSAVTSSAGAATCTYEPRSPVTHRLDVAARLPVVPRSSIFNKIIFQNCTKGAGPYPGTPLGGKRLLEGASGLYGDVWVKVSACPDHRAAPYCP